MAKFYVACINPTKAPTIVSMQVCETEKEAIDLFVSIALQIAITKGEKESAHVIRRTALDCGGFYPRYAPTCVVWGRVAE